MLSQTLIPPSSSMQTPSANGASTTEQHLRAQLELLKDHDAASASLPSQSPDAARDPRNPPLQPGPARAPNGYDGLSQEALRALAAKSEVESHIHPDLRASPSHGQAPTMMPIAPPTGHNPVSAPGPSAPPIAPAPPVPAMMDEPTADGRKAKRELSQSKRAAQNRAAQRAFRQRKEGHIRKLEQQVRDYAEMEHNFKAIQSENYALREYVLHLQARLIEVHGEAPPPPPNVNLSPPGPGAAAAAAPPPPPAAPEPSSTSTVVGTPLEAVAQAVAGLAAQEQMEERQRYPSPGYKAEGGTEDTRSADEINRQLQQTEEPAAQSSAV